MRFVTMLFFGSIIMFSSFIVGTMFSIAGIGEDDYDHYDWY